MVHVRVALLHEAQYAKTWLWCVNTLHVTQPAIIDCFLCEKLTLSCCCRLFLVEGIVAVLVSVSFFWMPKDIDALKSLTAEEREALHASMVHHAKPVKDIKKLLLGAVKNPAVWIAGTGIKFLRDVAFYGENVVGWLPYIDWQCCCTIACLGAPISLT